MPLAIVNSRAQCGIEAPPVRVEVHISGGLPKFCIVGLPEVVVRESKDRVRSAMQNAGFQFPLERITVNLAPAELPKEGGRFDLPIAIGIISASGQMKTEALEGTELYGELSLAGDLRPFHGALPAALQATAAGRPLVVPQANAAEAALVKDARVLSAAHLLEVCAHCEGGQRLPREPVPAQQALSAIADLADVRGQAQARRALEIAAAGAHNLLLIGPPGTGKSMLAHRLPGILPPLSDQEALETASIHSISGLGFQPESWRRRPFRAPHHTSSAVALVGGSSKVRPGEISLAHHGVLFLDELPEYQRQVLEALREPLENGRIVISRAARQAEFPARFQLIAAMNPCPCGYLGEARCRCDPGTVDRYRRRLSGPLIDRLDLHVEMPRPAVEMLRPDAPPGEPSAAVAARVKAARARQRLRRHRVPHLAASATALLEHALQQLGLSARSYRRITDVARTIADLAESHTVKRNHIAEALALRRLDRGHAQDRK